VEEGLKQRDVKGSIEDGHENKANLVALCLAIAEFNGGEISKKYITDMVLTMIAAAKETTSQVLTWIFYQLCCYPDVYAKATNEVRQVFVDDDPTPDTFRRLPYCTAVFNETMRVRPPTPVFFRFPVDDITLPDGTLVRKSDRIMLNAHFVCRSERVWGPDAKSFRPERWLEMKEPPSTFDFPVFGGGPRTCAARHLVPVKAITVMAMIIHRFTFRLEPDFVLKLKYGPVPCSKNGLPVIVDRVLPA